ncbi:MAG: primosomal protein N' [Microbacteriaceae bacterium]
MTERIAQVLLDSPLPQLDHLFDYAIPRGIDQDVVVGCRVRVPLRMGKRVIDAYVVNIVDHSEFSGTLQNIDSVVTSVSVLPTQLYALARRVSDRQAGSAGDVLRLAIPPRYARVEKAFMSDEARQNRAASRKRVAEIASAHVQQADHSGPMANLQHDECRSVLMPAGMLATESGDVPSWTVPVAAAAVESLKRDESTIIAVPSYRESDDMMRALASLGVSEAVVRTDSRQSGGERYAAYLRILEREPTIVLGNRSSLYAPAHNLGLIVMWDDGDSLLTEPLAPYAHARDVALIAAQLTSARLVFAGHAVSTDVERLVALGFATEWTSKKRDLPTVIPTDSLVTEGARARIPSVAWAHAREQSTKGPVLLQVARAGYAPSLACNKCRVRASCPECSGPLAQATATTPPSCQWCGALASRWKCPDCASSQLRIVSSGSERTAEDLGRAFPNTKIIVSDGSHPVQSVANTPCLVISTPGAEPAAEGGYLCVVVLDGEVYRSRSGLRVDEVALRHWCNALALSRAGATCYLVGAGADLGRTVASWDLRGFARRQLNERRALGLPPIRRVASITGPSAEVASACDAVRGISNTRIMGPTTLADSSRAFVVFDYRHGERVASALRASIVTTATKSVRRRAGEARTERVVRLRIRMDDAELGDTLS